MVLRAEIVPILEMVLQVETLLHLQTETAILPLEITHKINLEVLTVKAEQTLLHKITNVPILHQAITLIEVAEAVCLLAEALECPVVEVVAEADRLVVEDKNYLLVINQNVTQ